ncbi:MAG: alpha/beta hydrolase [Gemmataceae bacterium]
MLYSDLSGNYSRLSEGFYTSAVDVPECLPVRTFLPTGYEPGYAYPLLVFFHGHGSDEEHILRLAPRLSRRNFICVGLRGTRPVDIHREGRLGYSWGSVDGYDAQLEDYVLKAVEHTAENYHIHPDRIYLAGVCEGATQAYRLGLMFPDTFSGIISLNGSLPRYQRPLLRLPTIRDLHIFVGHGIANAIVPISLAKQDYHLLYTAGVDVTYKEYATNHRLHHEMLKDLNRWIIQQWTNDWEKDV